MKITFLGTGTSMGVPVIGCDCRVCQSDDPRDKRLRTSILIETDDLTVVIDTGPDFRQQMLRAEVQQLDAIIFTHEHKDHTAGLDDIRAFNFKQRKPADIYATKKVQGELRDQYGYIFENHGYPGLPRVNFKTISSDQPFTINGVDFIPILVYHYMLPVLGFRIGDFTFITDANRIERQELDKVKGSKYLVLNALRKEEHLSHFSLEEAMDIMNQIQPEQGYFVHMSHQMGRHSEIEEELPDNVALAYDGLDLII